ncbi:anti-sigma factor antagonist [Nocardia beijingensis]|uniref:anti-sigma factor antagonist n=1 Tax=Nocardia beijingensis TaxID=95162 RepID=UPI0018958DBB|nr:anti-sigma factor antagonist [Nocardia beijingensis]MBF6469674.1 anti-sigma factor antagonist [Nocardia beijingensis]
MRTASHDLSGLLQPPEDVSFGLRATVERRGDAAIIHAHGEVDAYTLPMWRRVLREAATAAVAPGPVVVDASGLGFMACRPMLALAEESEACRRRGVRLCVVGGRLIVARVIDLLDLDALLPIYSSVDDALAGAVPGGHLQESKAG